MNWLKLKLYELYLLFELRDAVRRIEAWGPNAVLSPEQCAWYDDNKHFGKWPRGLQWLI